MSPPAPSAVPSRLPGATFVTGTISAQPWRAEAGRFDVVVACEVLYYVGSRPVAPARPGARQPLRSVFVTCYAEGMDLVRDAVVSAPGVQQAAFRFDDRWCGKRRGGLRPGHDAVVTDDLVDVVDEQDVVVATVTRAEMRAGVSAIAASPCSSVTGSTTSSCIAAARTRTSGRDAGI